MYDHNIGHLGIRLKTLVFYRRSVWGSYRVGGNICPERNTWRHCMGRWVREVLKGLQSPKHDDYLQPRYTGMTCICSKIRTLYSVMENVVRLSVNHVSCVRRFDFIIQQNFFKLVRSITLMWSCAWKKKTCYCIRLRSA